MQRLTFRGFTKRYVASLSLSGTTAIYQLVREVVAGNPRLREPLFLYAISNGHLGTLLTAARNTELYSAYTDLSKRYNYEQLLDAMKEDSNSLPEAYQKVWTSYKSIANKPERDNRVKALIRIKILKLQDVTGVTTYRICKELRLNTANVNAWLKNGYPNKVSLNTARTVLEYLEDL